MTATLQPDLADLPPAANRAGASFRRHAGLIVLVVVGQFVAIAGLCIALYPGGNEFNRSTPGYSAWHNVLCDLGKNRAMNGLPNPLAMLFNVSFVLIVLSFVPLWLAMPGVFRRARRTGRCAAGLGLLSIAGAMMVALLPADSHGYGHMVAIGSGAIPGLLALALSMIGLAIDRNWRLAAVSLVTLACGLWAFWHYVDNFWLGHAWTQIGPQAQKLAAALALVWMTCVGLTMRRNPRSVP